MDYGTTIHQFVADARAAQTDYQVKQLFDKAILEDRQRLIGAVDLRFREIAENLEKEVPGVDIPAVRDQILELIREPSDTESKNISKYLDDALCKVNFCKGFLGTALSQLDGTSFISNEQAIKSLEEVYVFIKDVSYPKTMIDEARKLVERVRDEYRADIKVKRFKGDSTGAGQADAIWLALNKVLNEWPGPKPPMPTMPCEKCKTLHRPGMNTLCDR